MSAVDPKRTCDCALRMSASDPKLHFHNARQATVYLYFSARFTFNAWSTSFKLPTSSSTVLRLDFEEYQNLGGNDETTLFCESTCGLGGGHSCCNTRRRCS